MNNRLFLRLARAIMALLLGMGFLAFVMGWVSRQHVPEYLPTPGSQLRPCPTQPNCVLSTAGEAKARVEPLWRTQAEVAGPDWGLITVLVQNLGGTIQHQRSDYLWAVFTSRLAGFADDVEILRDADGNYQVRSASRLGYSDLGVNRQRVDALRSSLHERIATRR